jgi:ribosomal protein S27E
MCILGLILTIFGAGTVLTVLGILLVLSGAAVFFYGMVWMVKLQKEPTRHIYCPYCASKNDVFVSRKEFACDICGRRIAISPSGEPIPIEPIEEEE